MKTRERRQLKENELAQMLTTARERFDKSKRTVTGLLLAVIVVAGAVGGTIAWRRQSESRAEQLLGEAMVAFNARVVPVTAAAAEPGEGDRKSTRLNSSH